MEPTKQKLLLTWVNKVNEKQMPLNKIWLDQQVKRDRMTYKWIKFLDFVKEKLEFIYPDHWDIQLSIMEDVYTDRYKNYLGLIYNKTDIINHYCFNIIIKFPEITITNSVNESHQIKDLYVQIPFLYCDEINNFITLGLLGRRGTYTKSEYLSKYSHSHLYFDIENYVPFCIGETETTELVRSMIANLDKNLLEALLLQAEQQVKWESIEGMPYIQMCKITSSEAISNLSASTVYNYLNLLSDRRRVDENRFELQWKINNSKIELVEDEILEEYLKIYDSYTGFSVVNLANVIVARRSNGQYVQLRNLASINIKNCKILFKGEYNKVRILEDAGTINKFYIHPDIKRTFKQKIEDEANNAIITAYRAKRINKFGYPKEAV